MTALFSLKLIVPVAKGSYVAMLCSVGKPLEGPRAADGALRRAQKRRQRKGPALQKTSNPVGTPVTPETNRQYFIGAYEIL